MQGIEHYLFLTIAKTKSRPAGQLWNGHTDIEIRHTVYTRYTAMCQAAHRL